MPSLPSVLVPFLAAKKFKPLRTGFDNAQLGFNLFVPAHPKPLCWNLGSKKSLGFQVMLGEAHPGKTFPEEVQ